MKLLVGFRLMSVGITMSRKFSEKDNRSIITRRLEAKVSLLCAKSHNKLSLQVSLKLANDYFQRCGQKVRNILHNRNEYKLLLAASYDVLVKKRMKCSFKPDANARFVFLRETKFLALFPPSVNEFNVKSLIFVQFNGLL